MRRLGTAIGRRGSIKYASRISFPAKSARRRHPDTIETQTNKLKIIAVMRSAALRTAKLAGDVDGNFTLSRRAANMEDMAKGSRVVAVQHPVH